MAAAIAGAAAKCAPAADREAVDVAAATLVALAVAVAGAGVAAERAVPEVAGVTVPAAAAAVTVQVLIGNSLL